jgi:hypothetical protein
LTRVNGRHVAGSAGGGAMSFTTWHHNEFVLLQNSWTVHIVMSSSGSSVVSE